MIGEQLYINNIKIINLKYVFIVMFLKKQNKTIVRIYQNIVKISRSKFFYTDLALEDTFETRFDLIIFHAFMIFHFYKEKKIDNSNISQELFDYMFGDFENNLREMGFGDIAVNKKMKTFIKAFYGRIAQYNKGIGQYFDSEDKTLLEQSILNNIFKGKQKKEVKLNDFVVYMINNINHFMKNSENENLRKNFNFINFN